MPNEAANDRSFSVAAEYMTPPPATMSGRCAERITSAAREALRGLSAALAGGATGEDYRAEARGLAAAWQEADPSAFWIKSVGSSKFFP